MVLGALLRHDTRSWQPRVLSLFSWRPGAVACPGVTGAAGVADVDVVIVSFNTKVLLESCLRDIVHSPRVASITVVDNGSKDGSPESAEKIPRVTVIRSENHGFSRAVNTGARVGQAPLLLLVNPDVTIPSSLIDALAERLSADEGIGVVAPAVEEAATAGRIYAAGYDPDALRVLMHFSGLSRWSDRYPSLRGWHLLRSVHREVAMDVDWVSGACLLTRRALFESIGGLNERWFMYAEDLDYCRSVRENGYRVVHDGSLSVEHVGGASGASSNPALRSLWVTNLIDYHDLRISESRWRRAIYRGVLVAGLISRSALAAGQAAVTGSATSRKRSISMARAASAAITPRLH